MTTLFIFLAGLVFIAFIYPMVEAISELFCTAVKLVEAKLSVKITDYGCQIAKLQNSVEEDEDEGKKTHTQAIGFVIPNEEEEYDDEE